MPDRPATRETAGDGRGGIPRWWFGAPAIAFLYSFVTSRIVPDLVPVPNALPQNLAAAMRWFVGLLIGVALLSLWRLTLWIRSLRRI
jgi:hypothetical protein